MTDTRPEPVLVVAPSADQLSDDVAGRLVATLVAALAVRPLAYLAVTGGGILEQTMRALNRLPIRDSIDWQRVSLWWADERFVPADSDDRNDKAAFTALFDDVDLDPANVHRMPAAGARFGDDAQAAASGYAEELADAVPLAQGRNEDIPTFDAILLGIGPDAHCASLFPGNPATHQTEAAIVAVPDSPKPPPTRLSFTFRALDSANEVWFIAAGSSKAQAVAMGLSEADRVQVPAAGPRGRYRTLWLVDRDAAKDLPPGIYGPPSE
jgi:6-phosphogluconolactonase